MARFTVLGGTGFIGSHLLRYLRGCGDDISVPARNAPWTEGELGHVVYCIGLTADFRTRPYETMEAHVTRLSEFLQHASFDSLLYLSSTRVYGRNVSANENEPIVLDPNHPSDLYNASKVAGESLCLTHPNPSVRVVRLSNVFGPPSDMPPENFICDVLRQAVNERLVRLQTSAQSAKDYVSIDAVVRAIRLLALAGRHRLYNVASGRNTTAGDIVRALSERTGCEPKYQANAPTVAFPEIDTRRLCAAFDSQGQSWAPTPLIESLDTLIAAVGPEPALAAGGKR